MATPRINRIEHDRDDGVMIETDALTVELLPYATWREDGDSLPDAVRDLPAQGRAWRFGSWVLSAVPIKTDR